MSSSSWFQTLPIFRWPTTKSFYPDATTLLRAITALAWRLQESCLLPCSAQHAFQCTSPRSHIVLLRSKLLHVLFISLTECPCHTPSKKNNKATNAYKDSAWLSHCSSDLNSAAFCPVHSVITLLPSPLNQTNYVPISRPLYFLYPLSETL
jgi:hypothetical protein